MDGKEHRIGAFEVINRKEGDFTTDDNICNPYPTAKTAMWQGADGKAGQVLCMAPAK